MSSPNFDSVLPDYWEVGRDSDPVPPELLLGGPRFHCRLDGTRVWALQDAVAHGEHFHAKTVEAEAPRPDESHLRRHALEQAVKAGLGFGGGDSLARETEKLVAYLRDGTTTPDPNLGIAKGADLPGQPGAPAAVHEAIDRAWRSIVEDGERLAIDSDGDGDEEVLEQLRTLTDDQLNRTSFVQAIVRALTQAVRADRRAGQ